MDETSLIPASEQLPLEHRLLRVSGQDSGRMILVLLHGMGSNEGGMMKLAEILPFGGMVYSLRAPYVVAPGKFAWYEADLSTGTPTIRFDEAEKSRALIRNFLEGLRELRGKDTMILVGGFSQGGVMAYNIGLTMPELVHGIFIMGSRLQSEIRPFIKPGDDLRSLEIYIGHGTEDKVLAISHAHEAADHLRQLGLSPDLHEYTMGHTIGPEMMKDLSVWVEKITA
jgi:phospholipase/carboxylesterase